MCEATARKHLPKKEGGLKRPASHSGRRRNSDDPANSNPRRVRQRCALAPPRAAVPQPLQDVLVHVPDQDTPFLDDACTVSDTVAADLDGSSMKEKPEEQQQLQQQHGQHLPEAPLLPPQPPLLSIPPPTSPATRTVGTWVHLRTLDSQIIHEEWCDVYLDDDV